MGFVNDRNTHNICSFNESQYISTARYTITCFGELFMQSIKTLYCLFNRRVKSRIIQVGITDNKFSTYNEVNVCQITSFIYINVIE